MRSRGLTFDHARLRQERLQRREQAGGGWTLDDAARRMGASETSVMYWEKGSRMPGPRHLQALCRVYGLEPWDLMPPPPEGPRLLDLRMRSCLTQQQVADRLQVGQSSYSHAEIGRKPLTATHARQLARLWRLPVDVVVEASKRSDRGRRRSEHAQAPGA